MKTFLSLFLLLYDFQSFSCAFCCVSESKVSEKRKWVIEDRTEEVEEEEMMAENLELPLGLHTRTRDHPVTHLHFVKI